MVLNRQTYNTLNIGFSAAFQKGFEETPVQYEKIATVVSSSTKEQTYGWIGKLQSMREWIGERTVQNLSLSDYSIKNKSFETTVGVDRDDIEDDTYGIYGPIFMDLGQCARQHPNKLVFDALKGGFENRCFDGKTFFATDHPNGEGKTYSNRGTKKLTAESYQEARSMMMNLKDEQGNPLGLVPNVLVVSPSNEGEALRILKAEQIEGTSNIYKDTAELLVEPELGGEDTDEAWYLLCTRRPLKPIIFQERKKAEFTSLIKPDDEHVFMEKQYLYGVDSRCNVGYGFPQMAFGSDGKTAG